MKRKLLLFVWLLALPAAACVRVRAQQITPEFPTTARLWEMRGGGAAPEPAVPLSGHGDDVTAVAFSPDGRILATAGDDKKIILWEAATGRKEPGELRSDASPHAGAITSIAFSPNGRYLVSGDEDRMLKVWDLQDATRPPQTLEDHKESGSISAVAFSRHGKLFASVSRDGTLIFWNAPDERKGGLATRAGAARKIISTVHALAFSPDGKLLAIACGDSVVRLWGVGEGQVVRALSGHKAAVTAVAFSRDGRTLASGSEDDTVGLWSPAVEKPLRFLTGHAASVTAVAFDGNNQLVSGSWDGSIRFWNPATGDPRHIVEEKGRGAEERAHGSGYCVTSLSFSEDGRRLASGSVYAEGAQRLFILSVGLKGYQPPLALPSAQENAQQIADLLERGGQRIAKGVSKYVVLDGENTREALTAVFGEIGRRATQDDMFVFYYAGRRAVVRRQNGERDYYLTPTNVADIKSEAALSASGIPVGLFKQWLDSIPAQKQLLLLDGTDLDDNDGRGFLDSVKGARVPLDGRPDLAAASAKLDRRSLYMMSMSIDGDGEPAKIEGCEGTPFTCLTLRGLAGAADADKNRKVTTKELSYYLNGQLDELSNPQHMAVNKKWGAPFPVVFKPEQWSLPERWRGKVPISKNSAVTGGPLRRGKSYALLIATSEYDHNDEADGEADDDGWKRLPNAVPDAKRIKSYLEKVYGFEKPEVLENPTYAEMVSKIHQYEEMAHGPDDQLLIYFAGHGIDNKYDEGYIVARNARKGDPEYKNYLNYTELRLWLNKNSWRHVLVILDVCYGGNFNPEKSRDRGTGNDDFDPDSVETATPYEIMDEVMPYNARRFIASGAKNVKDGYEGGRSPFTNNLLGALQWGRDRSVVTADQIVGWLKTESVTPKPVAGRFGDRDDPQGDFIFFTK